MASNRGRPHSPPVEGADRLHPSGEGQRPNPSGRRRPHRGEGRTRQFARAGTESLESPQVFQMPDVLRAGGLEAIKILGEPADILHQTKERLFAA